MSDLHMKTKVIKFEGAKIQVTLTPRLSPVVLM